MEFNRLFKPQNAAQHLANVRAVDGAIFAGIEPAVAPHDLRSETLQGVLDLLLVVERPFYVGYQYLRTEYLEHQRMSADVAAAIQQELLWSATRFIDASFVIGEAHEELALTVQTALGPEAADFHEFRSEGLMCTPKEMHGVLFRAFTERDSLALDWALLQQDAQRLTFAIGLTRLFYLRHGEEETARYYDNLGNFVGNNLREAAQLLRRFR